MKIRKYKNHTKCLFLDNLSRVEVPKYMDFQNIDIAFSYFIGLVTNIVDEISPLRKIYVRKDTQE